MNEKFFEFTEITSEIYYEHTQKDSIKNMSMPHFHNSYEIYYLIRGEINYLIGDKIYDVCSGDLVLIPKSTLHRTVVNSQEGYERILVNISDEYIEESVKSCFEHFHYHLKDKYAFEIKKKLFELGEQYSIQDEFQERMIKDKIYNFLVYLVRINRKKTDVFSLKNNNTLIDESMRFISEHFSEDLTLQKVADYFAISREYFSSIFNKETGYGFSEYLNQVRISHAMELLKNPNMTVTEAAYKSGFNDSSYFAVVFKKISGISPKKFQNMVCKE